MSHLNKYLTTKQDNAMIFEEAEYKRMRKSVILGSAMFLAGLVLSGLALAIPIDVYLLVTLVCLVTIQLASVSIISDNFDPMFQRRHVRGTIDGLLSELSMMHLAVPTYQSYRLGTVEDGFVTIQALPHVHEMWRIHFFEPGTDVYSQPALQLIVARYWVSDTNNPVPLVYSIDLIEKLDYVKRLVQGSSEVFAVSSSSEAWFGDSDHNPS